MTELGRSEVGRGVAVRAAIVNESLDRISSHNRQLLVYLMGKVSGTRETKATERPTKEREETEQPTAGTPESAKTTSEPGPPTSVMSESAPESTAEPVV